MRFSLDEGERLRRPPGIWQAWPALCVVMLLVALAASLVTSLVGLELEGPLRTIANGALVLLPLGLWWVLYYRPVRQRGRVPPRIVALILLAGVLANGVAVPVVNELYAVDTWLFDQSGLTRIIGYMLIVGFLQEYLKFAIIRYTVYPGGLVERGDGLAYGIAVSLGFAVVLSLHFFIDGGPAAFGPAAARVAGITLSQVTFGAILGYFFTSARFSRREPPVWWFVAGLTVAAFFNGLYVALRAGLVVGGFGIGSTANVPLLPLLMAGALALGSYAVISFLNRQAEIRDAASPGRSVY